MKRYNLDNGKSYTIGVFGLSGSGKSTLTHSTGFKFTGAPISVDRAFNHSMDKAVMNVASGAFSSEQAVEQVVSDLEKSGLRYVNYASGVTRGIDQGSQIIGGGGLDAGVDLLGGHAAS